MVNVIPVMGETQIEYEYLECSWNGSIADNSETSHSIWWQNPCCFPSEICTGAFHK